MKKYFMIVNWISKTPPRMSQLDRAELLVTNWGSHTGSSEQRRSTKTEWKRLICAESFFFLLTLSLMRVPTLTLAIQLHSKKPNGAADKDPFQLRTTCAHRSQAARCSAIVAEAEDGWHRSCGGTWTGRANEASQRTPRAPESVQI